MGRLGYLVGMGGLGTFYRDCSAQWVLLRPKPLSDNADTPVIVTYKGMGRDIWTVPFDDITAMLKVRHLLDVENLPAA